MVLVDLITLIIALAVLLKGADWLVDSSIKFAKILKVNNFVIGLTLVAIGTSIPELANSIIASFSGNTGFVMGNIVGSNINNLSLILGIGAILILIKTKKRQLQNNIMILIGVSLLFLYFSLDGKIEFGEGFAFIVLFIAYMIHLLRHKEKKESRELIEDIYNVQKKVNDNHNLINKKLSYSRYKELYKKITLKELKLFGKLLIGIIAIYLGARFVVPSAVNIAVSINVPENIIALTLVAFGTTLPELATTIASAKKKMGDVMIGNLIGSNISNILLIIGTSSLITTLNFDKNSLLFEIPFMLLLTAILSWFVFSGRAIKKGYGFMLFGLYILFIISLLLFFV